MKIRIQNNLFVYLWYKTQHMDHFTLFKTSTALIIIHNAFISVMMHMILLYNIMYYIILSLIKKLEKQWSHATSK